jgi:hypothetical protein
MNGHTIDGHVPAAEIKRLLGDRPKVIGLAVPGMPVGSPGMEAAHSDAYSVIPISFSMRTATPLSLRALSSAVVVTV